MSANRAQLEAIETELLLEALFRRYRYDFRSYARASIERRIRQFLSERGFHSPAELIVPVLRDESFFADLARQFSIGVTEMFRDPAVYRSLRELVFPRLRTYPSLKIWHAGCATGEEVYSMAILLLEEELLDRTTLYGTDFNDESLARAREGIYPLERTRAFTENYHATGGRESFGSYFHARYGNAVMDGRLRERITFANHNLVSDGSFGEMHLVVCRNVLIYFDRSLQDRVLELLTESLVHGGHLCLGSKESLSFSSVSDRYEVVEGRHRIFRKLGFVQTEAHP